MRRPAECIPWTLLAVAICAAGAGIAAGPALQSDSAATRPTVRDMRGVLEGLWDADPAVREQSRCALLALRRAQLPALASAAAELGPLEPPALQELREIVAHVYLSEEPYDSLPQGFLGITMSPLDDNACGAVVESRMPGFCAYAALRDGDEITDIEERPLARPFDRNQFINVIQETPPGRTIHLKVLRQGRAVRVPVTLSRRPAGANELNYELRVRELLARRRDAAAAYWEKTFYPAIVDGHKP